MQGTVLVFAGFVFVLYREGLSGNVLILGFASLLLAIATILFGSWGGIEWFWGDGLFWAQVYFIS